MVWISRINADFKFNNASLDPAAPEQDRFANRRSIAAKERNRASQCYAGQEMRIKEKMEGMSNGEGKPQIPQMSAEVRRRWREEGNHKRLKNHKKRRRAPSHEPSTQ